MEKPSPITCRVTPWRRSLWPRPSTSSDSVDQDSMLMKPGATALPVASISRRAVPAAFGPTYAMRSPRMATSPATPGDPLPSYTVPPRTSRS